MNTNGISTLVDPLPTAPVAPAAASDSSSAASPGTAQPVILPPNDKSGASDVYRHTVVLDPATRDLIFRVIDVRSREVVRQAPDEAMLRMHAYAHALDDGKGMSAALMAANLEI